MKAFFYWRKITTNIFKIPNQKIYLSEKENA